MFIRGSIVFVGLIFVGTRKTPRAEPGRERLLE